VSESENRYKVKTLLIKKVNAYALPMIEVDARFYSMTFVVLGEPVAFQDQVLITRAKAYLRLFT
jgi:hypothetical protein